MLLVDKNYFDNIYNYNQGSIHTEQWDLIFQDNGEEEKNKGIYKILQSIKKGTITDLTVLFNKFSAHAQSFINDYTRGVFNLILGSEQGFVANHITLLSDCICDMITHWITNNIEDIVGEIDMFYDGGPSMTIKKGVGTEFAQWLYLRPLIGWKAMEKLKVFASNWPSVYKNVIDVFDPEPITAELFTNIVKVFDPESESITGTALLQSSINTENVIEFIDLNNQVSLIEIDLADNYYTKTETDLLLDNYYTKTEIDNNIYTKSEIDVSQADQDIQIGSNSSAIASIIEAITDVVLFEAIPYTNGLPLVYISGTGSDTYTYEVDISSIVFEDTTKNHTFRFNDGVEIPLPLAQIEGIGGQGTFIVNDKECFITWTSATLLTLTYFGISQIATSVFVDKITELGSGGTVDELDDVFVNTTNPTLTGKGLNNTFEVEAYLDGKTTYINLTGDVIVKGDNQIDYSSANQIIYQSFNHLFRNDTGIAKVDIQDNVVDIYNRLDMKLHRIVNLDNPIDDTDGATKKYADTSAGVPSGLVRETFVFTTTNPSLTLPANSRYEVGIVSGITTSIAILNSEIQNAKEIRQFNTALNLTTFTFYSNNSPSSITDPLSVITSATTILITTVNTRPSNLGDSEEFNQQYQSNTLLLDFGTSLLGDEHIILTRLITATTANEIRIKMGLKENEPIVHTDKTKNIYKSTGGFIDEE